MSSPAGPSDTKDADRRKSLGKYVKRMSSVFKRDKPSKSAPSASAPTTTTTTTTPPAAPAAPAPKVEQEHESEQKEDVATTTATAVLETPAEPKMSPTPVVPTTTTPTPSAPVTQELNRAALQQERARALFAKYGLTLESHEWISASTHPINVQRVERPIRMRVHRSCHHCGTSYGPNKVCAKCEHKRCKKCPRYPPRKTTAEKEKEKEQEAADLPKRKKKLLTMSTKNGDERVYRQVKQRVRRSCHQCQAYFVPAMATVCENCRHVRCTKCPRDPAKLSKWPNGYPGDAQPESETDVERPTAPVDARRMWRKPRMRVRWECEACHSHFIEGSPRCPGCGHERCEKCTRKPMKKARKEQQFDPDVIRAVEEKLRALIVDDDHPTSGAETT